MLKRGKMFNSFFCWEKMLSNFQLSGAPALEVGTNGQQSARVSEGYSVIESQRLCFAVSRRNRWAPRRRE